MEISAALLSRGHDEGARIGLHDNGSSAPLGRSRLLDQCSDQPQQGLMLGATPAAHEEVPDLNMCRLTAGGRVGLVLAEHPLRRGLSDERPSITIWRAAIKLSPLERHRILPLVI